MASHNGNKRSEPPKFEQIMHELFSKIRQIILESRCPHAYSRNFSGEQGVISSPASSSSSSSIRSRDKWFNLAMRNCPDVREELDLRRQSSFETMVVDVILMRGSSEKIIERWVLQYEGSKENCSSSSSLAKRCTSLNALYRKLMLLLRSLYSTVRLLPAYKFFRGLNSSCQIAHQVSAFVEPFTHIEESEMQHFLFTPLQTNYGRISLSVLYIPLIPEANSDNFSSRLPISSPHVISNYIGSSFANPIKKFPSQVCSLLPPPPPRLSIAFSGLANKQCSSSSASKSDRKSRLSQNSPNDDKQCPFGKPSSESGRSAAVKTSFSSRLSLFEDKFDDTEFCGAFVVDEDLTNDPTSNSSSSRSEHFDEKLGRQDVAVGALIQMLNKATPLHVANVKSSRRIGVVESRPNLVNQASSGGCLHGKTTDDALEELRNYRDVKHLMLNSSSGTVGATIINLLK